MCQKIYLLVYTASDEQVAEAKERKEVVEDYIYTKCK